MNTLIPTRQAFPIPQNHLPFLKNITFDMQTQDPITPIDTSQDAPPSPPTAEATISLTALTLRTEWMSDDGDPWTRSDILRRPDTEIIDESLAGMGDVHHGEPSLWEQTLPGPAPGSEKSAHDEPSSTSSILHRSSNSTPGSYNDSSSLCDGNEDADLDISILSPLPPPRTSQLRKPTLRNPKQTARFQYPESVPVEAIIHSDLPFPNQPQSLNLDHFLDKCIAKTQALLKTGISALNSEPDIDEILIAKILEVDERGPEDEEQYPRNWNSATARHHKRQAPPRISLKISDLPPKEVVRVQGWWKVKGGEAWREVVGDERGD
ncbi:hypothetical protein IMSHALPRED_007011 [Imshaugia aleurites]|uniref:Uncharacterized protein n=1 Tax=Imshaugia aleurites TaxID=172621 RepID=A0A8H3IPH6_9LECA|nr:hypothetical protein IMSHALPRED_007011 [Imshaugia aleurites]